MVTVVDTITAKRLSFGPFGWMLFGLVAGAAAFVLIAGGPDFHGYGWLTEACGGTSGTIIIVALLLAFRRAVGLGTKIAGELRLGQRAQRQRDDLPREPRRDDDVLRHRHRRSRS